MVSFTDHCNAISIDRVPSKNKKTEYAFFIKNTKKNNHSSTSDCWENIKCSFKENAGTFSKTLPLKKILEFQD